ncbi:putative low-specificity L-threonine aldolase 1 [Zea mays]|uniref:Putative low-specificity L-threonine aldolase 1 n=1 Tax=Zea mays TaxID=4577 RepID=A0A1D6K3U3_MAIZE|nr:putative low-specificity L-threonine aldolase 1 [Zea mays]ONL98297.1 putative low-specificity L-threonine aldolase 1 [Zea mays]ONL98298.1 putative low-specificity L-threonine aldolase 1 [Zea mays]ONL98299.1 putative low-specificity L-threonine aldolase 1 [Zea mays]ONL98302.1 putative low-specificity L-threonine aldolase 1 [Zea mays]
MSKASTTAPPPAPAHALPRSLPPRLRVWRPVLILIRAWRPVVILRSDLRLAARPHPHPRAPARDLRCRVFTTLARDLRRRPHLGQGTESPTGSSSPPTGSNSWRCSSGHPISSPPASTSRSAWASNPTRHRSPHQGNLDFLLFPQKIASVTYIAHGNRSNFFGFGRLRATGVLTLCMSKCSIVKILLGDV